MTDASRDPAAVALAAKRWATAQACICALPECGKPFESGQRTGPRYCSLAHRQKAYRQRKAQEPR